MNEGEGMKCPDCGFCTVPVTSGRQPKAVRGYLTKHLQKVHGYSRRAADDKMEELGYAVEGTDLAEFMVQFESWSGSL